MAASRASLRGVQIGLRLHHCFGHCCALNGAQIGFGLIQRAFALGGGGNQVAVLERGQELALLYMIAAVHVELLHRRGDLGHHAGLILREQNPVAVDDAPDGRLRHRGDLNRRRRRSLVLFLRLGAGQHEEQRNTTARVALPRIRLEGSRERLEIGERLAIADHSVIIRVASLRQSILRVHQFQNRGLAGLITQGVQPQALGGEIGGAARSKSTCSRAVCASR